MIGVPVDLPGRLLGCVDERPLLERTRVRPGAIEDAGLEHARADLGAGVETRHPLEEYVRVIGHVARAGDAVGDVEHSVGAIEVLVVVPHAGHEELAVRIDDLGFGIGFQLLIRGYSHDALAANQDACSRCHGQIARIEEARVANDKIGTRRVRKFAGEASKPGLVRCILPLEELGDCAFMLSGLVV